MKTYTKSIPPAKTSHFLFLMRMSLGVLILMTGNYSWTQSFERELVSQTAEYSIQDLISEPHTTPRYSNLDEQNFLRLEIRHHKIIQGKITGNSWKFSTQTQVEVKSFDDLFSQGNTEFNVSISVHWKIPFGFRHEEPSISIDLSAIPNCRFGSSGLSASEFTAVRLWEVLPEHALNYQDRIKSVFQAILSSLTLKHK